MNIELYINNRLCDIESPEKLGITLKRVFINPSELNVKDAQKSYTISLPATPVNNEIFNYANVEETQGKFKIYGDARLYVDGVLIIDGKFRLSEITKDYYRGNLGVPAPLTVKDVFGETMMNQAGRWMIPFKDVNDITSYNTDAFKLIDNNEKYGDISPCIFPFVLYGLIPKIKKRGELLYSRKDVLDDTAFFDKDDFPPSVNCVHLIRQIFENAEYNLSGTALKDPRLKNLYMSYKNKNDFNLPWSVSEMRIAGNWAVYNGTTAENEYYKQINGADGLNTIAVNLFDSYNINITDVSDSGGNIKVKDRKNPSYGESTPNVVFTVPRSGLYKVVFKPNLIIKSETSSVGDMRIVSGSFLKKHEIKLVRNYSKELLKAERFDNKYYRDNINQTLDSSGKKYPQSGGVNFIDFKQNSLLISGMTCGFDHRDERLEVYRNPLNNSATQSCPMAITGGRSWDENLNIWGYSAVNSKEYLYEDKKPSGDYKVELNNIPYEDQTGIKENELEEKGCVAQVIWLNKDDTLSIVGISNLTDNNQWHNYGIDFSLSVRPFMLGLEWLKINENGSSDEPMNWQDVPDFEENKIDLIQFLSSDVKINDWIDNFCKAFNLSLLHKGGVEFELNLKGIDKTRNMTDIIDLDRKASVEQHNNESLKLPGLYELGFTIDTGEQGYYQSMKTNYGIRVLNSGETGGGQYYTGSNEASKISQTSNYSYCWYMKLKDKRTNEELEIEVPVISDHGIWDDMSGRDYEDVTNEKFYDKAQRFWYKSPQLLDISLGEDKTGVKIAMLQNQYAEEPFRLVLDYKDEPGSILRNYFLLMTDTNNNYTTVSCFLSPDEYDRLGNSFVKFNGDLYYVGEVDGYDPLGKNKTKLKLIRRLQ